MTHYGDPGHEQWLIEQEQDDEARGYLAHQEVMAEIGRRETEGLDDPGIDNLYAQIDQMYDDEPEPEAEPEEGVVEGYVRRLKEAAGVPDWEAYGGEGRAARYAEENGGVDPDAETADDAGDAF